MKISGVNGRGWPGVAVCLAALLTYPAYGWNDTGHMVVAYIAYQKLTPETRTRVDDLLKLNPMYASWTRGVSANRKGVIAFVRAATWPDCIKSATRCPGYSADGTGDGETPPSGPEASQNIGYADKTMHKYWHYVDKPYATGGVPGEDAKNPNAETEIQLLAKAIGDSASDDVKSYDVVWLEHMVGDVHQPLHCTSRFTRNHPHGDQGGNLIPFCQAPCRDELHAYWDSLLGKKSDPATVTRLGDALLREPTPGGADETDVAAWTAASFELAKSAVYTAPISGDNDSSVTVSPRPDRAYGDAALKVARSQVLLGGYRLAHLLNANLK
jgi:hypothetical protein